MTESSCKDRTCDPSGRTLSRVNLIIYLVVLGMLAAFGPVCTDIYLPALPVITKDLLSDPAVIQLSLTTSFLGLAVGQVFIGPISDALGRKLPLLISLILFAITSAACAMAQDVWFLIIMRFFQGCAGAGGVVLCRTMACDMFKGPALTSFMSILMTINSLAPICGPILGSLIVTFASWHYLFWFLALWGILLFTVTLIKIDDTLPVEKRETKITSALLDMIKQLLNRRFFLLTMSMSFLMGGFFSYLAASPFVFQSIYGYSPLGYSFVFGTNAILLSLLALAGGRFSRRVGDAKIVVFSIIVMLTASVSSIAVALIRPESSIPAFLSIMAFVMLLGASQTSGFTLCMDARTGGAGAASGLFGVMCFLFGAIMSPLVGLMGEDSMLPLSLCMLTSAVFALILFVVGLRVPKEQA